MCGDFSRVHIRCTPKPNPMKEIYDELIQLSRTVERKQKQALLVDQGPEVIARKIMALSEVKQVLREARDKIAEIGDKLDVNVL